jgi:Tfp pilus tip-associated adhesin PilY1
MTYTTSASWWPALKALLGPQTSPPAVLSPPLADADAGNSLRFIWGDRDAVMVTTKASQRYQGLKLGDIFHSSPLLVGRPTNFAYYVTNLHDYSKFLDTYRTRRRVLYFGANDGLFHAIDAGVWDRDRSVCEKQADGTDGHCHDLGTGAELFAFAPRSIMQTYKIFKDTVGPQYKRIEYSVDGPPTAADVFIDASHSGSPTAADRAWHTVLIGGMREGSNFQGSIGATAFTSQGSYFALDVTQPDELTVDADGNAIPPSAPGTFAAPRCLNASGDPSCGKDAADPIVRASQPARAWPTVLWEITDRGDLDVAPSPGAGYPDMGETWSKPVIGRVRICTANCGRTTAPLPTFDDRYVAIFGGGFSRQRSNRHGNWLYIVDIETGRTLYRANSSCGVNSGAGGCTPTYFASIPSEVTALDFQGDGYLDRIYVGDLKGQLWRVDLSDLRTLASPPAGRFDNQLDFTSGSGKPFLLFRAPQPVPPATVPYYPIYLRPLAVSRGYSTAGGPALGIAFGTGDRDDILSRIDPANRTTKQRYYYVVDEGNTVTRTESDLMDIASPTAAAASSVPENGWYLELLPGERLITDSLAVSGVLYFGTFTPVDMSGPIRTCSNGGRCSLPTGKPRFYRVAHMTGDPYLGSDRGEAQADATFLSEPVFYMSKDQQGEIVFSTENTIKKENARESRKTSVRSWKEKSRRP